MGVHENPPLSAGGTALEKSEDTPVEKCSKARRVPTETGFKLRVALPRSQQSKGYPSVTFALSRVLYQAYRLEHDKAYRIQKDGE